MPTYMWEWFHLTTPTPRYGVGMCGDGANDCGVSHPMCDDVTRVSVLVPRP